MSEQIGFSVQSHTLVAGEQRPLPGLFDFWRVLELTGTDLKLSVDGGPFNEVLEGMWYRTPGGDPFEEIALHNTSAAPVTVKMGRALGQLGLDALVVSGTLSVDDGGGSLTVDGAVSVTNFPATFDDGLSEAQRFGQIQIGASFAVLHNSPLGASTLISAASNTGGCVVRTLWSQHSASQHTLSIHTVPLTALGQGKPLSSAYNGAAVPFYHPPNLLIPAGNGLYYYSATTGNSVACTFDLL